MNCDKCGQAISEGEERTIHGEKLCEDCAMDALSPPKACDPWAVFQAKSALKREGDGVQLTETQQKILQFLKETGGAEPKEIEDKLGLTSSELRRELATLRHMEKTKGRKEGDRILICLWD